jgi:glutamine cyclotransferase
MKHRKQTKKSNGVATAVVFSASPVGKESSNKTRTVPIWLSFLLILLGGLLAWGEKRYYSEQQATDESPTSVDREAEESTPSAYHPEVTQDTKKIADGESNVIEIPMEVYEHFSVIEVIPHDTEAFTQGLTFHEGRLWEGTGYYDGQSQLRRVDPRSGQVLKYTKLAAQYFGEGIAFFTTPKGEERIIQLTWREKTGWIYDAETLKVIRQFTFETNTGEGWGITYRGGEFIVTDGSDMLYFWDAETLQETRRLHVLFEDKDGKVHPVPLLNEIEYYPHDGTLLSHVWYRDILLKIDIESGRVRTVYNFGPLYPAPRTETADCFNGVALASKPGQLYVTGKYWPYMYRIELLVK